MLLVQYYEDKVKGTVPRKNLGTLDLVLAARLGTNEHHKSSQGDFLVPFVFLEYPSVESGCTACISQKTTDVCPVI